MNIQQKKSDAMEDPVMGRIVEAKRYVEKNGRQILTGCAAALLIVCAVFIYRGMSDGNVKKAQELFGIGVLDYNAEQLDNALASFSQVADNYKRTPLAPLSAFMMGSIHLQQGDADKAITRFESVTGGGLVKAQAFEGLAAAYEAKGDAGAAIRYLERALADKNAAHRHPAIRWKLALLNRDNANAAIYCKDIIADTMALSYHQKAENLLVVLNNKN